MYDTLVCMRQHRNVCSESVRAVLQSVNDPELGVSIIDLGLVYDIEISDSDTVHVRMTLTSIGCPLFPVIEKDIKDVIGIECGIDAESITVELVFDPPWGIDKLTENGRALLGIV